MSLARCTFLLRATLMPVVRNVACRPASTRTAIVLNDFSHGGLPYRRFYSNVGKRRTTDDTKPNVNANDAVSVVLPGGDQRIMTLHEAHTYARKQNCDLIDVWNEDEQRTLYCLMSKPGGTKNKELYAMEKHKGKQTQKRMKLFSLMTNISQQDLSIKCKKLIHLLKQERSIRVSVWAAEPVGKKSTQTQAELIAAITKQIEDHGTVQVLNPEVKLGAVRIIVKPRNTKEAASS